MNIMRIWHGCTAPENADAHEQLLKTDILPGIHCIDGYLDAPQRRQRSGQRSLGKWNVPSPRARTFLANSAMLRQKTTGNNAGAMT